MNGDREFSSMVAQAMLAYREALDRAVDLSEVPVAEFATTVMLVDADALSRDPSLIPEAVTHRFNRRRFKARREINIGELQSLTDVEPWLKKQVRESGYGIMAIPLVQFEGNKRGRRHLSYTERQIRDALRFWTHALLPEISKNLHLLSQQDRRDLAGLADDPLTIYDLLAISAPDLVTLSRSSVAGRKNDGMTGDVGDRAAHVDLETYIYALADEGRKLRVRFPGEESSRYGESSREKAAEITASFERHLNKDDLRMLMFGRVGVLQQLAKASRIAAETTSKQRESMAAYERSMGRIERPGAHHILRNPDDYQKRDLAAAREIQRAQFQPAYVQPPGLADQSRLSSGDIGLVALLCDADPYTICVQHMFLSEDIEMMRGLGKLLRGQSVVEPARIEAFMHEMRNLRRSLAADGFSVEGDIYQIAEIAVIVPEILMLGR
ncbi:hypothetical protein [Paracoccus caeni]|nr:hypothetical protein [Paracoccus caeni]